MIKSIIDKDGFFLFNKLETLINETDLVAPTISPSGVKMKLENGVWIETATISEIENKALKEKEEKHQFEKDKIENAKFKAYVESVLTPTERLSYYPEWAQKAYPLLTDGLPTKVIYKGKVFQNNVEGNINAPDKGGWTEVK